MADWVYVRGPYVASKANWGLSKLSGCRFFIYPVQQICVACWKEFIPKGLSAAIYTQVSDVEGEVNGLMTYDRRVVKMPAEKLNKLNSNYISHCNYKSEC
jgi:hypothetical protein